jgi:hypothetical protein
MDVEKAIKMRRGDGGREDKGRMGGKRTMGPVVDRKQRRSSGKVSANVSNIASTETPLESELTLVSTIGMN